MVLLRIVLLFGHVLAALVSFTDNIIIINRIQGSSAVAAACDTKCHALLLAAKALLIPHDLTFVNSGVGHIAPCRFVHTLNILPSFLHEHGGGPYPTESEHLPFFDLLQRGFDPQWLSITFSKAIFLGNGLVAIVSGLFANLLAENLGFGPVAPFDAAACFLAIGMAIIMSSWSENYGDPSESKDLMAQFKVAAKAIASDEKIALLGAIQSLFEGSMYTFVFLWTPALSPNEEDIPHGFIFATFMLSSMLGSSIASRLLARKLKVEGYMQIVFSISAVTLVLPVVTNILVPTSSVKGGSISVGGSLQLLGFCTFEACVGIFWPSIMKMRSQYIPEEARSTIMNFFRIPLNLFVCVVLYNVNAFPITVMFGMCSIFLFMAAILQRRLMVVSDVHKSSTKAQEMNEEDEPLNP